ncbi:MAG TPA: TadE/TadG family type IV pilus assembly protein [Xanthobacteraceae bacterium]|nr:TadE/TadG family type IV pilus assembly protein [Xanthobacteraceae bacterium]
MLRNLARLFRRNASAFKGAQQGATAVEFALIAPAFIALLIAIFETTQFLYVQANLQVAATQAARLFMTGQAQSSGMSQAQIEATICPTVKALVNCANLVINVQSSSSATGLSTSTPQMYNAQGQLNSGNYSLGTPGDLMVVQIGYPLPVVAGPLGFLLSGNGNGTASVWGVAAFRVEPYAS